MELGRLLRNNYYKSDIHYVLCRCVYELWLLKNYRLRSMEYNVRRKFRQQFGRELDLEHPSTLNEKIQWLKLNEYNDYFPICADKYAMKQWTAEVLGTDKYNVPVLYHTSNWRDITPDTLTQFPCIVKANHSSHDFIILRSPEQTDWSRLRRRCRFWLHRDYALESQENQYRDIPRQIVVEPLLMTAQGHIPNDYKLNFMNGQLQFVYVAIDREGCNARAIYDADWNLLPFNWDSSSAKEYVAPAIDVPMPASLPLMKELGAKIARYFKYVRVDFYDVDGEVFIGEITLHHGGGYDRFRPAVYDEIYGNKLNLSCHEA